MYPNEPFAGNQPPNRGNYIPMQRKNPASGLNAVRRDEYPIKAASAGCESGCEKNEKSDHSYTVGACGPVLLTDSVLHERLEIFVNRKPIERALHVKGWGALGYFQPYRCMSAYTTAKFLLDPAKRTPVLARFSLAASNRGTPDTSRDIRGFAVKFYTEDGILDLVGNNIPIFFIRDAMLFSELITALTPSPRTNLADPEALWGFVAAHPETVHMLTWLYSDAGYVKSYRHMPGHGINTFVWRNAEGKRTYVKYHWYPVAGEKNLTRKEAEKLAGEDPDVSGRDLHNALAAGKSADYEFCVQMMDPMDADRLPFDPLDDTKVWSEKQYPLIKIGKLTLDRNPEDYKNQIELAAFSPNNLVEGIELSDDRMLQGRSNIYWDAHRRRLGPDFRDIPVNRVPGWTPAKNIVTSGYGNQSCGRQERIPSAKPDYFTQAGERYRSLSEPEKERLIDNIASELHLVLPEIQQCVIGYLSEADREFGSRVRTQMEKYRQTAK